MKLAEATWQDVRDFDRNAVVLIPTGSLEQHGPHLPLFTDSILATAVAEAVEKAIPNKILLTPTLWLGASAHHMAYAGTMTASFGTYIGALQDVVESQLQHGFTRFFVLNGHGGNCEPNGIAMRELKISHPSATFVHSNYYTFAESQAAQILEGPAKRIQHACEAEASLILHVRPELVRKEKLRDDGLKADPPITGLVTHFDEITEEGSLGYATLASPEKGKFIFESAVAGVIANAEAIYNGHVFVG